MSSYITSCEYFAAYVWRVRRRAYVFAAPSGDAYQLTVQAVATSHQHIGTEANAHQRAVAANMPHGHAFTVRSRRCRPFIMDHCLQDARIFDIIVLPSYLAVRGTYPNRVCIARPRYRASHPRRRLSALSTVITGICR